MSGTASVPNTFATQVGQVPASQLDANWTALTAYINSREVSSGTLAARPTTPDGGTWYFANDQNGGTLYFAAATGWVQAALPLSSGTVISTLVAPITITDATAGGQAHPWLNFQKTGSDTWQVYWQKPVNFGGVGGVGSETLTIATLPASGLQLHLIADPGGQRLAVWDPSNPLPNIPHTGILPTMAVYGDVLIGDIVALASNPMTYFIRANSDIPITSPTQLFSSKGGNVDQDGGPTILMYPGKTGGGAVSDGYIQLIAYGMGTGSSANEIQFRHRSSSNTVATTWHIGGGPEAAIYPDTDATMDIGTPGTNNRVRAIYVSSGVIVGGRTVTGRSRLMFSQPSLQGAGQTRYLGMSTSDTTPTIILQYLIPYPGTLRNLYWQISDPPGAGQSQTIKVLVNGSLTLLTSGIQNTARTGNNTSQTWQVVAGDSVTFQAVSSTGPNPATFTGVIELDG